MQVPMLDLKAQYAGLREEVLPAVAALLESQDCCNGQAVRELERQLADFCSARHALGVSSGTDALLCILMALGIGPGDEVITTPFTFFGTAGVIWRVGAKPVFVDIEPTHFNLDPDALERAITPRTKAIMPVHLYGQMADMDAILAVARRHNLPVIEDAAQAIGATQNGRQAGSLGLAAGLSFYPTKNLGAAGDAGMMLTNDDALADRLAAYRIHGGHARYVHKWVGGNFRMDSLQAVVLSVKLRHLSDWTGRRQRIAARYSQALGGCPGVGTPSVRPGNTHIYHQYVIRAQRRDRLQEFLQQAQIASGVFYPIALHLQECFAPLGHEAGDFPHAEQAAREVLALPIYAEMADQQIDHVAGRIREFYASV